MLKIKKGTIGDWICSECGIPITDMTIDVTNIIVRSYRYQENVTTLKH